MSFWSWIGLPDKKDVQALQSEIDSLKEENKAYAEMNDRLIKFIGDVSNKRDMISGELTAGSTQMNTSIADTHSEIGALRTEIRDNILLVRSRYSDFEKRLQQLSADMEHINSSISTINDIDSDLKSLTEYVNCLWSATKALWVDSIISNLDNIVDNPINSHNDAVYDMINNALSELRNNDSDYIKDAAEDIAEDIAEAAEEAEEAVEEEVEDISDNNASFIKTFSSLYNRYHGGE